MYLTAEEVAKPMSIRNTFPVFAPPKSFPEEKLITNKMPVELSCDISTLFDTSQIQEILSAAKDAQKIVDEGFDPLNKTSINHDMVYHKEAGLVTNGYETWYHWDPTSTVDPEKGYHSISFMIYRFNQIGIGYAYDHAIYDSFGIHSRLSEILKIDQSELDLPHDNLLDITHLKPHTAVPWGRRSKKSNTTLDQVHCQILLNGDATVWARTTPRSTDQAESYSEKLSSTKLTAYNPYILGTRTTTTEDTYILNIRFNTMTFTRLLELTNSK